MPPAGLGIDFGDGDVSDDNISISPATSSSPSRPLHRPPLPPLPPHLSAHGNANTNPNAPNYQALTNRQNALRHQRSAPSLRVTSVGLSPTLVQSGTAFVAPPSLHNAASHAQKTSGIPLPPSQAYKASLLAATQPVLPPQQQQQQRKTQGRARGRSVRIASGQPGIMGHAAGDGGSPNSFDSASSSADGDSSNQPLQQRLQQLQDARDAAAVDRVLDVVQPPAPAPTALARGAVSSPEDGMSSGASSVGGNKKNGKKSKSGYSSATSTSTTTSSTSSGLQRKKNVLRKHASQPALKSTAASMASAAGQMGSQLPTFRPRPAITVEPVAGTHQPAQQQQQPSAVLTTAQLQAQVKAAANHLPVSSSSADTQGTGETGLKAPAMRLTQSTSSLPFIGSDIASAAGTGVRGPPRAAMMASPGSTSASRLMPSRPNSVIATSSTGTGTDSGSEASTHDSRARLRRAKALSSTALSSSYYSSSSSAGSSVSSSVVSDARRPQSASMQRPPAAEGVEKLVQMRSARGMRGLEHAELGGAMISLESIATTHDARPRTQSTSATQSGPAAGRGSFQVGEHILPDKMREMEEHDVIAGPTRVYPRRPSLDASASELEPLDSVSNIGRASVAAASSSSSSKTSAASTRKAPPSSARPLRMARSMTDLPSAASAVSAKSTVSTASLQREATLLSASAHPARRARELNRVLGVSSGNSSASKSNGSSSSSAAGNNAAGAAGGGAPGAVLRDSKGSFFVSSSSSVSTVSASTTADAILAQPYQQEAEAQLEHDRASKARVGLDLMLESDLVVEGSTLSGKILLKVRKDHDKKLGALRIMQPKVRIVGFEELTGDDVRHIFFHQAAIVSVDPAERYILHGSPTVSVPEPAGPKHPIYSSPADREGYYLAKEGEHTIPFSLEIPIGKGAKGSYRGKHAVIRYIAIASVKLKSGNDDASAGKDQHRSIAHFYRHVELYPYLNPAVVLSSAPKPITATVSKGLFMGGNGKVHLTATLHRGTWVAGQRVYVRIGIRNETSKKIKGVNLALVRTLTLFRPREDLDMGDAATRRDGEVDPDACTTSTSRKKLAEDSLEMGQKGSTGTVTARGWWTGVESGRSIDFSHSIILPADALSISRSRHVEVMYSIKVSVTSTMSSNVSVELPMRIINFISLDPPPKRRDVGSAMSTAAQQWHAPLAASNGAADPEEPLIQRVRTAEALGSPTKVLSPVSSVQPPLPAGGFYLGNIGGSAEPDDKIAQARRLQHQKSLDFIHHAIRSATARRGGPTPLSNSVCGSSSESEATGLGIAIDEDAMAATPTLSQMSASSGSSYASAVPSFIPAQRGQMASDAINPSCLPYVHPHDLIDLLAQQRAVELDDLDEDDDDKDIAGKKDKEEEVQTLNDESIDDINFVLGTAKAEEQVAPAFGLKKTPRVDEDDRKDGDEEGDDTIMMIRPSSTEPVEGFTVACKTEVTASQQSMNTATHRGKDGPAAGLSPSESKPKRRRGPGSGNVKSRRKTSGGSAPSSKRTTPELSSDGIPSPLSSLAPNDSASRTSSPASSVVQTPESATVSLPTIDVFTSDSIATEAGGTISPEKVQAITRTEVITTPARPIMKLRATASLADLSSKAPSALGETAGAQFNAAGDGKLARSPSVESRVSGLTHSSSTHNLRGASIVVPSVRNKIAALENRQSALRNFARPGSEEDAHGLGDVTPKKLSTSTSTPGRVAQLAANAEAAAAAVAATPSPSLKRAPSVMSYKAPIFKPLL